MAKRKVRKSSVADATPEMRAKAKKLQGEGKSYKEIATALGYKYDKAAWNLLNPGPTGRHRGDKAGKAPSGTVPKGKVKAGKPKAAEGSVGARRTGRKRGETVAKSPVEAPPTAHLNQASAIRAEESGNKPGSLTQRFGKDKPVARPPDTNGNKEEVKAVPKPKDSAKRK